MIVALFGGSFDPVHCGHVALVRHVLEHGLADRVVVVPNTRSPWRDEPLAAAGNRLAMCRLAFAGMPTVEVDGREAVAGRPAWTVDTLAALVVQHPGTQWRLVIGADHLATFGAWRDSQRILEMAELLVLGRSGAASDAAAIAAAGLPSGRVVMAPPFDHPVSGSIVRAILCAGGDGASLLPPAVAAYIAARGLYRVA
ncbi:MAG: nicotinate (nicotinamide) nucleotide adenylyltransferase [bacterium]|nr:nicotinate (nicotinamide) nucleotide adenylyltransferase [bacterium]